MGEQEYPLDFTPQCHHLRWLTEHLGGWQFGEQVLISELCLHLGLTCGSVIEYGAGDGVELPLTVHLLCEEYPERCVCVEIDELKVQSLRTLYPRASVVRNFRWIKQSIQPDVVVIDIDGSDSVVMREMFAAGVRPKLMVVEHMDRHFPIGTSNPGSVPPWMLGLKLESGYTIQDTAETLHAIAAQNGYERIGFNRCNSFFVVRELFTDLFR